jgi:DNA polymerase V
MPSSELAGLELRLSSRVYGLVDCNSFYCSCERVFQPKLNGKPVGVLSNNDGCIIALTPELKALGVSLGAPPHLHRSVLEDNQVALFSSNYELYGDMSARVMGTLQHFSSVVEVYSIDEAFVDLSHYAADLVPAVGRQIRNVIYKRVGIPVGVGIGPTKTLAKLANRYAKEHGGVYSFMGVSQPELLKTIPIRTIWGVSHQYQQRLQNHGIKSVWDLMQADDTWLMKFFPVTLVRTVYELRGYECLSLAELPKSKRHILNSRSFGQYISDKKTLASALSYHASRGGEEMRKQKLCANALSIFIKTNRNREDLPQYYGSTTIGLELPTDYTPDLIKTALQALDRVYKPGYKFQKAGVILLDLVPDGIRQQSLWTAEDTLKGQRVMQAMDTVNGLMGKGTLRLGTEGFGREWVMRQEKLSPRYTTRWDDLLRV